MYKYLLSLLLLFITACASSPATMSFQAHRNKPMVLPPAQSSWYAIQTEDHIFKAKNLQIIKGELTLPLPRTGVVEDIYPLKGISTTGMVWQAVFNIVNQQEFSISMVEPVILFKINDDLTLTLSEPDLKTYDYLMSVQEDSRVEMNKLIYDTPECIKMIKEVKEEKGNTYYVRPSVILDWLPELYQYDGPKLNVKEKNNQAVYLTGHARGNKMFNAWLLMANDHGETRITLNARLTNVKTGDKLDSYTRPLNPDTKLFLCNNWLTHTEFLLLWQNAHPGKAAPSILPDDAGVVVRTALTLDKETWSSDALTGGKFPQIIIRSNIFIINHNPGQMTQALIGEAIF